MDLTDANVNLSANQAYACSMGNSPSVPPPSNCATFDYGAIGGVPTTLGGSFLMYGGITGSNTGGSTASCGYTLPSNQVTSSDGLNSCNNFTYALTVDGLSKGAATSPPSTLVPGLTSATESISSWVKVSDGSGDTSPGASAAGSAAYSTQLRKAILFGGVTSLQAGSSVYAPAADSNQTWIFDLETQGWARQDAIPYAANDMVVGYDGTSQLSKEIAARAYFGFAAVPNISIDTLSYNGTVGVAAGNASIDTTEKIVVVGGIISVSSSATSSTITTSDFTLKFNPTFGPEKRDIIKVNGAASADSTLVHWTENYHTQLMNSLYNAAWNDTSLHKPTAVDSAGNASTKVYNFGTAPITYTSGVKVGTVVTLGGFDPAGLLYGNGNAAALARINWARREGNDANVTSTADFSFTANSLSGTRLAQVAWDFSNLYDIVSAASPKFEYGGSHLLPGFTLGDIAYFGGATCQSYLDPNASTCNITGANSNPGYYVTQAIIAAGMGVATAYSTAAPLRAGMATARGRDESGNIIIVAWGGVSAAGTANDSNIYVLYNSGVGVYKWRTVVVTGAQPTPLADAAMVYSHVTDKFYIFGGYQTAGVTKVVNDTWELSVSGDCTSNGVATPTCTFSWRQLNTPSGLSCNPTTCPEARRGHRIVEANYNNTDPSLEPDASCSSTAPCSFGIFMQGGTTDGIKILSDRWMFDPTANGGSGHWQKVGGFPPRNLASLATFEYRNAGSQTMLSRALLYGGQTGMHNSRVATTATGFIAPTLADTYMYDFSNNTWNRVHLYGKGYKDDGRNALDISSLTQFEIRQSYLLDTAAPAYYVSTSGGGTTAAAGFSTEVSPNIAETTPPPLAGATLVTRTYPSPLRSYSPSNSSSITQLKIPEVFLFGGRKKDGKFMTLNQVYKFCPGSTGEKPSGIGTDNANCDAWDISTNQSSTSPVQDFGGRWLRKQPESTVAVAATPATTTTFDPATIGTYMGAGAYDPLQDKILFFGGISPTQATSSTDKVTDSSKFTGYNHVFEYTPPSKVAGYTAAADAEGHLRNGVWDSIPPCTYSGSVYPEPRYGHSMGFDPMSKQVIIVGGYAVGSSSYSSGTPLASTYSYAYGTYVGPEVWTGKRIYSTDSSESGGAVITSAPCYLWKKKTTFGNDPGKAAVAPPQGNLAFSTSVYIPASGYNSGYYTMLDYACGKAGPVVSNDPTTNKLLAGGAYIDLNRDALKADENLVLNLTYMPLSSENLRPDAAPMSTEVPIFRIHLVRTNQVVEKLRSVLQPRYLTYSATDEFPHIAQTLSVLAPPYAGGVRQEQIFIPLAQDPLIDRIRIERYAGSAILIDATIYRTGKKEESTSSSTTSSSSTSSTK